MRISRLTTIATILIIMLSMVVPLLFAADSIYAEPATTIPVNETPL